MVLDQRNAKEVTGCNVLILKGGLEVMLTAGVRNRTFGCSLMDDF
jgi:hypothetical protein